MGATNIALISLVIIYSKTFSPSFHVIGMKLDKQ